MKNQKTYHFRDNDNLLENIDKGNRSKFIRDALKLKFNIDDIGYREKQATNKELICYYNNMIEIYEKELDRLQDEIVKTKQYKKKLKIKVNKIIKQDKELNNQIETKKRLLNDTDKTKHRNEAANTLIKNIILMKNDTQADSVNIDYLKSHGNFRNNTEFKIYVQEYIIKNVKTNSIIANTVIKPEDIEYLKNQVNQRIPWKNNTLHVKV